MKMFYTILIVLVTILGFAQAQEYTSYSGYSGSYTSSNVTDYNYTNSYSSSYGTGYNFSVIGDHDNVAVTPVIVGTQNPDERDAFRAAQAYAMAMWEEYVIDISYLDKKLDVWHYMVCTANLQGQITSVILDDKFVIRKGEALLPGIPLPEGGMRYAYIYVDGVVDDEPMVHGNTYYEHLKNGDRVSVVLRPKDVEKYIPSNLSSFPSLPDNVDPYDVRLVDQEGNWVGYYYPWLNGFILWVDPTRSPFYASIVVQGYEGNFGSFIVDPLKQEQKKFKGASLEFSLLKGVKRILRPTDNEYGFYYQSHEKVEGQTVLVEGGKVLKSQAFIYNGGHAESLRFFVEGYPDKNFVNNKFHFSAYYVGPDGELELISQQEIIGVHGSRFAREASVDDYDGTRPVIFFVRVDEGALQDEEVIITLVGNDCWKG